MEPGECEHKECEEYGGDGGDDGKYYQGQGEYEVGYEGRHTGGHMDEHVGEHERGHAGEYDEPGDQHMDEGGGEHMGEHGSWHDCNGEGDAMDVKDEGGVVPRRWQKG
ncbi:hypothetical protein FRC10_000421 [Ceratobasidium sp. 414]|nr:hypothetical protein FRC10_000421 [Ceratobasidium sp. 414]